MVHVPARPGPKPSHAEFPNRFLTGKELDPDRIS